MSNADIVNAWFGAHIATGAIARNTDAYNQALAAKTALITALDAAPAPASVKATKVAAAAQAAAAAEAALAAAETDPATPAA